VRSIRLGVRSIRLSGRSIRLSGNGDSARRALNQARESVFRENRQHSGHSTKARESVFRENRQHSGSPIEVAVRMTDKGA
jgi:hypothetical protein